MPKINLLTLRLCSNDHNDIHDLRYELFDNSFVRKWIQQFRFSQSRGDQISSRDGFYFINDDWSYANTIDRLNITIYEINRLVPDLIPGVYMRTDHDAPQDDLNFLHSLFERYHGGIDSWQTDPFWKDKPEELRHYWSDLNNLIHRTEAYRNIQSQPRIKVTWYDTPKVTKLTEEDYNHYEIGSKFGFLYSIYSDVGKDLISLARDNDHHHLDFVPPTFLSADFQCRFWTDSEEKIKRDKMICDQYFEENKDFFAERGYQKDDPIMKASMGCVPMGKLLGFNNEEAVLKKLSRYSKIQSVHIDHFDNEICASLFRSTMMR